MVCPAGIADRGLGQSHGRFGPTMGPPALGGVRTFVVTICTSCNSIGWVYEAATCVAGADLPGWAAPSVAASQG
eukprot:5163856-Pyramimonas_sp.AAC.1